MTLTIDHITPANGFPSDMSYEDKIFVYGQSLGFPEMSDDDKMYLLKEGLRYHVTRNEHEFINPYYDPNQVLDLLKERKK